MNGRCRRSPAWNQAVRGGREQIHLGCVPECARSRNNLSEGILHTGVKAPRGPSGPLGLSEFGWVRADTGNSRGVRN